MRFASLSFALVVAIVVALFSGCTGCDPGPNDAGPTDAGPADAGPADAGTEGDGGPRVDGGPDEDAGPQGRGPVVTACEGTPSADPGEETCAVVPGTSGLLIVGDILTPGEVFEGGAVLLDEAGVIQCVGCGCFDAGASATQVICPDAVVSPGLINAHDHIGWMNSEPWVANDNGVDPALRWEHRHDWRTGRRGHPKIVVAGGGASADEKALGELRFVLGGATSVFGSGSAPGLLRNLDGFGGTVPEIDQPVARYDTFPLGDSNGTQRTSDCSYPGLVQPGDVEGYDAYVPHVSEGIDPEARNEFLCLTGQGQGAVDVLGERSAVVHGVGVTAIDVALMATRRVKLIWSPRSNISLYGETAPVTLYHRLGVSIGLGTDWLPSGSMNVLRELACADELNQRNFGGTFTDEDLWLMATLGAARALAMDDAIGVLAPGRMGDIAVFRNDGRRHHRAILEAGVDDVALVLRGGKVLSGDAALVEALEPGCDLLSDVCGVDKRVCINLPREVGKSVSQLEADIGGLRYPLFFCGVPENEPTCVPARTLSNDSVGGSNLYEGMSVEGDRDGDGVPDEEDNCPDVFNPIRPLDAFAQADTDADGPGDACDPCPLDAHTTECAAFDPNDADGDGTPEIEDNCPALANPDQADADDDGKGDACDPCPDDANPGSLGCPASVYDVKTDPRLLGSRVSLSDMVVTAVLSNGFFLQLAPESGGYAGAEHSGIFVYTGTGAALPTEGELLRIDGATVTDFYGQVQLTGVEWVAEGTHAPFEPLLLPTAEIAGHVQLGGASPYEGLLVEVRGVQVTNADPPGGPGDMGPDRYEFEVTGGLRVDDAIYRIDPQPAVGEIFTYLRGPAAWRNNYLKLLPRGASDVGLGEPEVIGLSPSPAFQRIGVTGPTLDGALTVTLSRAPEANLTVVVTSADEGVARVPDGQVIVPAGETTAVVDVEGVSVGTTTLTAVRQGSDVSLNVEVRVLAANEQPSALSLGPVSSTVLLGQSVTFTVRLDIPAPSGGVEVTLEATNGIGTVPASVSVDEGTRSASFALEAAFAPASGEIVATLGALEARATVDVLDPAEAQLDIGQWQLVQENSSATFTFPTGTTLSVGDYVIVARDVSREAFEDYWRVTLGDNVVFFSAGGGFPILNGSETYTLLDADGSVVDGPTFSMLEHMSYQRNVPPAPADEAGSWTAASDTPGTPTPGSGQATSPFPAGIYISEISDAPGGNNQYVYEFVELYFDAPVE